MNPAVKAWLTKHAKDYAALKRMTGAGEYPFADNRCQRCTRQSDQALVPTHRGWWCRICCYPKGVDDDIESV